MQNKTTAKKKMAQRRWSGPKIGFIAIGLVLLASLALWGIQTIRHNRAVARERAQFMAAKADLHELAQQLAKEIGPPTASKEEQSCDYTNVAYGKGQLSCEVNLFIFYEESTVVSVMNRLVQVIDSKYAITAGVKPSGNNDNFRHDNFTIDGISCAVNFLNVHDKKDGLGYVPIELENKQGALSVVSCGQNALEPYFKAV